MADLQIGQRVRIYYNVRLKCLTVQDYIKGRGWRLHSHLKDLALTNVKFRVSDAGRLKCLAERQKNVHAYVYGCVAESRLMEKQWYVAGYNPYFNTSFVLCGHPIYKADFAQFINCRLFVD